MVETPSPAGVPPAEQSPQSPSSAQASVDEKTWALFTHLSGLSGVFTSGLGAVLGPLIVWLVGKQKHPFIDRHGKEALNFGITVVILMFALALFALLLMIPLMAAGRMFPFSMVAGVMFLLIPLYLGLVVFWFAFVIIATIKASNGEEYRYPVALRLLK